MRFYSFLILPCTLALSACGAPPNIHGASSYTIPLPQRVEHPYYDPTAAYGEANATWRPPVINLNRTTVKPVEPATTAGRPDYEHAQWASGASGGPSNAPPGTF